MKNRVNNNLSYAIHCDGMAGRSCATVSCHPSPVTRHPLAFTLIELLAVIGVIALLAALLVPLVGLATAKMRLSRVRVDLQDLAGIIQNYKETKGFYPPDNTNDPAQSQLFYELSGTIFTPDATPDNATYRTVSGVGDTNTLTVAQIRAQFGADGFANATENQSENPVFTHNFTVNKFATNGNANPHISLLICPVQKVDGSINPWNYNSSGIYTNLNNPSSFDLWVDIVMRGKTYRVCNWSTTPIVF